MRRDPAFATRPYHLAMATVLALLGVGICLQLVCLHFLPVDLGCSSRGCQQVLSSSWSTLWGLPLALYGGGCYVLVLALLAGVGLSQRRSARLLAIRALRVVVVLLAAAQVVLVAVQLVQLHALCPYCLAAAVISVLLAWWCILWTAAPGLLAPAAVGSGTRETLPAQVDPVVIPPVPPAPPAAPAAQPTALAPIPASVPTPATSPATTPVPPPLVMAVTPAGAIPVATAVAPLVWSGCACVLVLLGVVAVVGAGRAHAVVARSGGDVVRAADIDAASAGIRAIQARLGIDLQRALLINRIDHALLAQAAQPGHGPVQGPGPGTGSTVPARALPDAGGTPVITASTLQRLRQAAGTTILIPSPAAVVQPADWAAAYQIGSPTAPDQLLVVIDPGCGLCGVQVRELLTALGMDPGDQGPGWRANGLQRVRLGVLLRTRPDDAPGLVVAQAVAAADAQNHVWEFLLAVAQRDDPSTWDQASLVAAAQALGLSGSVLASDGASPRLRERIDLQSTCARRLLGDEATPRLFYNDRPLCGFAPAPALTGLVATEAAIRASDLGR